jgi:pilus assembly protein CpaB
MAMRSVLLGMLLLAVAGFLGIGWMALQPDSSPVPQVADAAPPPPKMQVLTAARALRAGALLGPDDLAITEVDTTPGQPAVPPTLRTQLVGGMIRHSLPVGARLAADDVLRPQDRGFLAAVLAPGMRAISIGVDAISAVAGLIWPGDRVDVILTQSIDDNTQPAGKRISGEIVLQDLRVIAVDQVLMQGAVPTDGAERNVRTVTLEVSAEQAERVAVATRLGKLSLVVHAAAADTPAASRTAPPVTWSADVSTALRTTDKTGEPVRVYRGQEKAEEVHF